MYLEGFDVVLTASTQQAVGKAGKYLCLATITGTVDYECRRNGRTVATGKNAREGLSFPVAGGFDTVLLTSATGQTAQLIVSDEPIIYNRMAGSVSVVPGDLTPEHGGSGAVDSATGVLVTPPAGTKFVTFMADDTNTDIIWLSGSAGNGVFVQAGASVPWHGSAATTVKSASGTQGLRWTFWKG